MLTAMSRTRYRGGWTEEPACYPALLVSLPLRVVKVGFRAVRRLIKITRRYLHVIHDYFIDEGHLPRHQSTLTRPRCPTLPLLLLLPNRPYPCITLIIYHLIFLIFTARVALIFAEYLLNIIIIAAFFAKARAWSHVFRLSDSDGVFKVARIRIAPTLTRLPAPRVRSSRPLLVNSLLVEDDFVELWRLLLVCLD